MTGVTGLGEPGAGEPPVPAPSARDWWIAYESIHAVVYFDPACRERMAELGLRGFWMGYFAGRAAPLGPVGPELVEATFFNFHPAKVRGAIPDAWTVEQPDRIWAERQAAAAGVLRRVVPGVAEEAVRMRVALARAADAAPAAGRPLFAATRAMAEPDDPVEALWRGCTCLREHRGDGHVAALTAAGLDGCEALVLFAASESLPDELFRAGRGWSEEEWAEASARLRARGLIDGAGITRRGRGVRHTVESTTDDLAARPLDALEPGARGQLLDGLRRVADAVYEAGVISYPNPMGLPRPPAR